MAPNPVAVLQSYVAGDIEFADERMRFIVPLWVDYDGTLTPDGEWYKHGWKGPPPPPPRIVAWFRKYLLRRA